MCDARPGEVGVDELQVHSYLIGENVELGPADKSRVGIHHVGIEAERGIRRNTAGGGERHRVAVPVNIVEYVRMAEHRPLGLPRRSRCVEKDEGILRRRERRHFSPFESSDFICIEHLSSVAGYECHERPVCYDESGPAVTDHEGEPLCGV